MLRMRSAAIALGLLIPTIILAAPPPVTGLSGVLEENGEVRIEWEPSSDPTVVRYRLYYSGESILEGEGVYDDFEETEGVEHAFVFSTPPTTGALYVTVLAVNNMGEESEVFVEEVKVDLTQAPTPEKVLQEEVLPQWEMEPDLPEETWAPELEPELPPDASALMIPEASAPAQSSSQAGIPTHTEPVSDGRLHLLLAEALSPIQVKLTFSDPVQIDPQQAPRAFAITGPGGKPLRITQMLVSNKIVVVDTEQQQRGLVYNVKLSEPLQGVSGEPLDTTDRTALFTGHEQGIDPATIPSAPVAAPYDPLRPVDVMGFALRAQPERGGTYTVTAQWQTDLGRGDIAHYIVRQSLDGGRTFGEPQMVPMDIAGVEFMGAQPGTFGISLQVVNVYGGTSAGVFDSVTLPGGSQPPAAVVQGSVTTTEWQGVPPETLAEAVANAEVMARRQLLVQMRSNELPDSGLGLFAVGSSLIGACVGWRKVKKPRVACRP